MSQHRLKCRNPQCKYEGMMEGKSDRGIVKAHVLAREAAKRKETGAAPPVEQVQIRCPKCGARWKMRSNQLH
jgi:DNA-directed RNA polymerase subunit M/transcription elongation factor TFIIS